MNMFFHSYKAKDYPIEARRTFRGMVKNEREQLEREGLTSYHYYKKTKPETVSGSGCYGEVQKIGQAIYPEGAQRRKRLSKLRKETLSWSATHRFIGMTKIK